LGASDRPVVVRGGVQFGGVGVAASGTRTAARSSRIGLVTMALDASGRG